MNKLVWTLLLSSIGLLNPLVFAQDSDQSSTDSGVLVSSPSQTQDQVSDQGSVDNGRGDEAVKHANISNDTSAQTSNPPDEIVVKSTNAVMLQITENMKLTQDQLNEIQPIIEDYISKVRDLQLSVEHGTIDSKAMNDQREVLTSNENQALGKIFTPDQMKVWINIQEE